MTVAMKGRIFHPNCEGWRSVPVAVIRDQLEEDPREASSSNGHGYHLLMQQIIVAVSSCLFVIVISGMYSMPTHN